MKKVFGFIALALALAACNKIEDNNLPAEQNGMITIIATLAPKTDGTKAVSESGGDIIVDWAEDEHLAILYSKDGDQIADARITAVNGSTGAATIEFSVVEGTPDDTDCQIIYPLSAAKDDKSGVKAYSDMMATQDGTLNSNLDVRVGAGTIQTATPGLTVTTEPAAQYAIFKFTLGSAIDDTHPLYIKDNTDAVITSVTPTTSTTTAYVALEPATSKYIKFFATTAESKIISKSSTATFTAGNFYQSTLAVPSLGDLYYSDGTYSTTLQTGKTAIGVIAYLGTDNFTENGTTVGGSAFVGHGLVMCLKNAASDVAWRTGGGPREFGTDASVGNVDDLKRTTNVSGYSNTKTLIGKTSDPQTYFPAAYYAWNFTTLPAPTTGTTGWFLPSAQQWVKMQSGLGELNENNLIYGTWYDHNKPAVKKWEAALAKAGSGNYDSMSSGSRYYWSSSENDASFAIHMDVSSADTGNYSGFKWTHEAKSNHSEYYRVRPVLAF